MDNEHQKPEFKEVYEAGQLQTREGAIGDVPYFVVPEGMKVETLEEFAEKQRARPLTLQQNIEALSPDSFIEYFNRFATESSSIFVNIREGFFKAILDYHEDPTTPAHRRHMLIYSCPSSKEWDSWIENNNNKMSQEDFALFIEDNLLDIVEPDSAKMLETVTSLKAKQNVDFKSAIRLDNGETQFVYNETIDGQAGVSGQLEIPEKIKLNIQPFQGGTLYELEARFRYRITQGGLVMWYTLIRPARLHDDAVIDTKNAITGGMTTGHIIEASI